MPDGLYVPEVHQSVLVRGSHPAGEAAALFCERELPGLIRADLADPSGSGQELSKAFETLGSDLRNWRCLKDTPQSNRWLLRRLAEGTEEAFKYDFFYYAEAARAILRRLKRYGLESEFNEADEAAMARLGQAS